MTIRPIRTKKDYKAALALVDELVEAEDWDNLDVLTTLVDAYEAKAFPIDPPDPIDAIRFRMEQSGMIQKDLANVLGVGSGRVSEILNGKRGLTVEMVRTLNAELGIPLESLIGKREGKKRRRPQKRAKHQRRSPRAPKTAEA